jgi:outer membrane cobalamin receptor
LIYKYVRVIRGSSSTLFGSGAMGGVLELNLKKEQTSEVLLGYDSVGKEKVQGLLWGKQMDLTHHQWDLVQRSAQNSSTIQNDSLNTHFQQSSGRYHYSKPLALPSFLRHPFLKHLHITHELFYSKGKHLGRSNRQYPKKIINVLNESHIIFKTSIIQDGSFVDSPWSVGMYFYQQKVMTEKIKLKRLFTQIMNQSDNFGLNGQKQWSKTKIKHSQLMGFDLYIRSHVDSFEKKYTFNDPSLWNKNMSLDNASKKEYALFDTHYFQWKQFQLQLGGRLSIEASQNKNKKLTSKALTGFSGIEYTFFDDSTRLQDVKKKALFESQP